MRGEQSEVGLEVLGCLRKNPGLSTREVANRLNRNRDMVTQVLKQLRDAQQVRSEQDGKAVRWTVVSSGE